MTYPDSHWMQLALEQAKKGVGLTHPNPSVGAVIVVDGEVLGKGFTQPYGGNHAEVEAFLDAEKNGAKDLSNATLYVTLEPCAAQGRTPPCTTAILASGIQRVVYASSDPNPTMAGGGEVLQQSGIVVVAGLNAEEANHLNRPFFKYIASGLPWVIAKAAISLDGKLATYTHDSQWISGKESRQYVHQVRALSDAIVVGVGTLNHDNPSLTVRDAEIVGAAPLRVVMANLAPKPFEHCKLLFSDAPSRMYILEESPDAEVWRGLGLEVVLCSSPIGCFKHLASTGNLSVLIEGGGKLHGACLDAQISDEVLLFQAPILIGGKDAVGFWHGLGAKTMEETLSIENIERQMLGVDMLIRGDIHYPH